MADFKSQFAHLLIPVATFILCGVVAFIGFAGEARLVGFEGSLYPAFLF